jgi:uncharacterized protein YaaN involved in tellurite resistance
MAMSESVQLATGVATLSDAPTKNLPVLVTQQVKKAGDLIESVNFAPEQVRRADAIAAEVDFNHSNTVLTFGTTPQQQMNGFLDALLEDLRVGEAGVAGKLTLELSEGYDLMRIDEIRREITGKGPGAFGVIGRVLGFVKDLSGLIKNLRDQKATLLSKFDKIERIANERKREIMTYNVKLDQLRDQSDDYVIDMGVHIAGGEQALLRGIDEFNARKASLEAKPDNIEAARLHDLARAIASFEQRLLRMKIAYTQAVAVTRPRIQAIRQAGEIEIQNIIESMLFDLPNLKALVLQVAAMTNLKQAQDEEQQRQEVSNKIAGAAADMFHETYTASVASQGRGLDQVRALAATADKLVATLREGERIEQENKKRREEAASALVEVKDKVIQALQEVRPDLLA